MDLKAWEDRRLRKYYYRIWWQQAIKSETFAHSLHKVLATNYVGKTAAEYRSAVEIGDLGLDKEGQRLMDTMRATLMRMEQLLALEDDTSIGSIG